MEEGLKNRLLLIVSILAIIFLISTIGASTNARRKTKDLENERTGRFELDEQMASFSKEKSDLEKKLKELATALEQEKVTREAVEKSLVEEKLASQKFKEDLEKMTRLKETLEEDLKEALHARPSRK